MEMSSGRFVNFCEHTCSILHADTGMGVHFFEHVSFIFAIISFVYGKIV